jgi:uncharacterized protein (DUF697 family)
MATQALLAQLRPAYGMRASPTVMKEIMREVLTEALAGQTYQVKFRVALLFTSGVGRPGSTTDEKYCR